MAEVVQGAGDKPESRARPTYYRRGRFAAVVGAAGRVGQSPNDSDEIRVQKRALVAAAATTGVAGAVWGAIYLYFDEPMASSIPLGYAVMSFINIGTFALGRNYRVFRFVQLLLILMLPFLLMVALGGFLRSGAVVFWSLLAPFGALLFATRGQAIAWFGAFLALVGISGVLETSFSSDSNLPPVAVTAFFVMNIGVVSLIAFFLVRYFLGQKNQALALLEREQAKSERLLLNVLPAEIAAVLKDDGGTIADHHDSVSVLFADVVGFTPLTARLSPRTMVDLLNEVFSHFDSLAAKHGLEKIRTIGDNYMVASGVPQPRPDHAPAIARMALEMIAYLAVRPSDETPLQFRIGINSGPVVAGVIGHSKFHYDVWGDAVNTASRMESHGVPGKIQITPATYEMVKDEFVCAPRGTIDVKGKGEMETWFLEGVRGVGPPDLP